MKKTFKVFVIECWQNLAVVMSLIGFLLLSQSSYAASSCSDLKAKIVSVEGIVELRRVGMQNWQPAGYDETLCTGDMLRVRSRSRASIRLNNESMIRLDQRTSITIIEPEKKDVTLLDLIKGKLHIITRTPVPFKIRTPFVSAAVEGTEFFIGIAEGKTNIIVFEGKVVANNQQGNLTLVDHESAIIFKDQAPYREGAVRLIDAVQWAFHYPTIIDYRLEKSLVTEAVRAILQTSLEHYRQGRIIEAMKTLDRVDSHELTPPLLTYRAGLLLSVGRVNEAQMYIEQVLRLEQNDSDAYALKALIAVVQNDKENAFNLAKQAIEFNPTSPAAKLAFSYAQQALFQIEEALISIEEAIQLDERNALVWARLAELQMSTGQLDRALESAQQAVNLNPFLAKTQTVLGFAYLLQINTQKAKANFIKAIDLDQADPMPRLGLGLALIREGKLKAGRVEIEIAASLDPLNSLIRSYLGKAYFEEKRYPLASTQFDFAKEHDPNDPTPWLYDGIMKQTQNRQAEALQDIEKSMELNNNRAVYRSRLLLDQDQAARGTSLSRIYDDFGFDQRALIQASKSLTFDPISHSSHRFLSDAYANMPHHEIARASELLQAQLLQPININPVQPRLGATDLNIITGGGPSAAFNEFTPLFERNRPQLVASGVMGNNGTLGNETIISGIYGRTSYSLGQFHYETKGFRPQSDLINNNYDGFFQYAVTPKLNIQAEMRFRNTENGNILTDRNPFYASSSALNSLLRREVKQGSARIGASLLISPRQNLIASIMYTDRKDSYGQLVTDAAVDLTAPVLGEANLGINNKSEIMPIASNNDSEPSISNGFAALSQNLKSSGYQAEAQYLFRGDQLNAMVGGGTYRLNTGDFSGINSLFGNLNFPQFSNSSINEKINGYVYTNYNFPRNGNTTLGLAYDAYKDGSFEVNRFNPKFGIQWDIIANLRLRFAWFEITKSSLVAHQTIEPTQVAGFNQMFDDPNGTRSQRMGIGLDSRISENVYSGIEASMRNLKVPVFFKGNQGIPTVTDNQEEQLYRAYLYWLVHKNWAVKNELQFEKFESLRPVLNDGSSVSTIKQKIYTFSAPISLNYTNPNGVFAKLTGTFVRQINSSFFTMDTAIGYRFPNRRGMLSLEGKNLLDQDFIYRSYNLNAPIDIGSSFGTLPRFISDRTLFMRLTLNF